MVCIPKNLTDFTRNRKLNATTTIKVTLNMQGNSLNAELLDAFLNLDDRMTASAYEQAKGKLKTEIFEHILQEYNKTMRNPKLLDCKYRVFAIDGSTPDSSGHSSNRFIHSSQGKRK